MFPGELSDERKERRRKQQEMQTALAEQIKEQRARKQRHREDQMGLGFPHQSASVSVNILTPRVQDAEEAGSCKASPREKGNAICRNIILF
eukprot:Skav224539  [mRNA]  locus=scaffold2543:4786:5058:- [translate_table: standard]